MAAVPTATSRAKESRPKAPADTAFEGKIPVDSPFINGGELGRLMEQTDWSATPLGPVDCWSPALRMMVRFLLANRFPQLLWWGPQFCSIYNDAYVPILGTKHPWALGQPVSEVWKEIWHVLKPLIETPFHGGPATWMEDIPLEVNRRGFMEETHFTIAYSAVPDEAAPDGIGGVIATVHEITDKIVSDRRVHALRDLGAGSGEPKSAEEACAIIGETLSPYSKDIPFLLLYLLNDKHEIAQRACCLAADSSDRACPESIRLDAAGDEIWPLSAVRTSEQLQLVHDLKARFDKVPRGPWTDPPTTAAVLPIRSNVQHQLAGFMVAGLSSRIAFEENYRGFLELMSTQIATTIANARAYEEERRRSQALAEIDRAKTVFFSNVSHEFRTPLTLMLGPLEDALTSDALAGGQRDRIALAHRNALRLLKLVNSLLDFSRIEAGRVQAVYEPIDIAGVTQETASVFRSAMEKAGLQYSVSCEDAEHPVYVDREMWEKILLNLVSNAFKFTLDGRVEVTLARVRDGVQLTVRDTGVGIPEQELPHIFERFHRVQNTRARTYEGTGIGLALVHELVRLHGGTVRVESAIDQGSAFHVVIPTGKAHLPPERVQAARDQSSTALSAEAYVDEAERWLTRPTEDIVRESVVPGFATPPPRVQSGRRELVVVADDNADMRAYLTHLLCGAYDVHTVSDGLQVLDAVHQLKPALVLTDMMMPGLDGFGVVHSIRGEPSVSSTPVILLSARAGEESRVEGLQTGADDYLVKPFSARELLARVESHIALSRFRRESESRIRLSEERFRAFVEASSDVVYRMSADWTEMRQMFGNDFLADTIDPDGDWLRKYIHPDDRKLLLDTVSGAIRTKSVFQLEHRVLREDGTVGWTFSRAIPILDIEGNISEWFGAASDITLRKTTEEALVKSEKMATLGRMAATISHEINNPLEALTNLLFLARTSPDIPEQTLQILETADAELSRIAHITRQSLGFYRESNNPAPTSIEALLDSSINLMRNKIQARRAMVAKEVRVNVRLMANAGELRQVFSNLLANALDAIDDGGNITFRVSPCRDAKNCKGTGVRISIADDGRGIDPAIRSRIFEPLFTTKGMVGTGLGLWVTQQIIEKHRGSIRVRSCTDPGRRGTTFSIILPLPLPTE